MAIFRGTLIEGSGAQPLNTRGWISVNLQTADEGYKYNPYNTVMPDSTYGSIVLGIAPAHRNIYIGHGVGFPPVLYDKMILLKGEEIVPYKIALGIVSEGSQENIGIWNSFARVSTVTNVTLSNGSAFDFTGISTGTVFGYYEEIASIITVKKGAPPIFEITITIELDNAPDIVIYVSGQLGSIIQYRPQSTITEKLEFKTDIITSRNGLEQRIGYRLNPRQSFAYKYELAFDRKAMALRNKLEALAGRPYLVPVWTEQRRAEPILALDTEITCDTENADFRPDGWVFIYQDVSTYETAKILSVGSGVLNLSAEIVGSFDDPIVMPINGCYANVQTKGNETPNGSIEYDVNFRVVENTSVDSKTFDHEYNSVPVIIDGGWFKGKSQRRGINSGAWSLDNDSGSFYNQIKWKVPKNSFEYGYHLPDASSAWEFRKFAHFLNGMQKTVWMPTLDNDFTMQQDVSSGDTVINVVNDGYAETWGGFDGYNDHVAIFDGTTWYFREITGSSEIDSTQETISIDSSLGSDYSVGELKIMRMPLVRLLSDTVKIDWDTVGQADASISFVEVQQ